LVESVMSDIASPFLHDIESRFTQLTPRETEICNMIRNGLQSKEIGLALGISVRTVEKFRQKIRDKLCVDKRDTNLTTFLRSITQKR
jgi:DNA-binding NarL/FixJ family response regulator